MEGVACGDLKGGYLWIGWTGGFWFFKNQTTLSCAASKAFARSLLELRTTAGADGDTPASHDVLRDFAGSVEEA